MASSLVSAEALYSQHLVVPGQVIAISESNEDGGFLRGHGTFIEEEENEEDDTSVGDDEEGISKKTTRLIASVAGRVERVNKLISVHPSVSMTHYVGQVGDLIIGRIAAVGSTRWRVDVGGGKKKMPLPLSGVHLPGGQQRIRTAQDALEMRALFREGDLLSAEITTNGQLHTRSLRYGKLQNGCFLQVPPSLIPRRKQHFCTINININTSTTIIIDVLLGCNGGIWIQRTIPQEWIQRAQRQAKKESMGTTVVDEEAMEENAAPLVETYTQLRTWHQQASTTPDERAAIARVRNAIQALAQVHTFITPQHITDIVQTSIQNNLQISHMMLPHNIVLLTECTRNKH
mmetsp:Transcript_22389/g.21522  ORF Transcript_22389/g.21522 Transcript_22389/m.21522 type:complete len:346 (-) Transcript_22389:60-1097(-)|eukprot:CAMPEP_0197832230 /NCGR_PEP_ID=MMETSP1437-20131217/13837_1 /TAXON_ID=49252 ORGANISM="Eucampia antarctica, Strain CCMP1452" /NCGR_SAMPLE_ID=MMETSP1437 /ASSEMBLY_ACC=CAM_ASM_001096 /LENGTH=345 /DNA_ID=CAMNT_0043435483 /DNA_START=44 /DNA_END=1081 /DNA_ORIENTATION=+